MRRLLKKKLAWICLAYLALLAAVAMLAPIVFSGVATQRTGNLAEVHQYPNADHWLGTDGLGRDILQRILVGARITLLGVCQALAVALMLGVPAGLIAGYAGGRLDRAISWFTDLLFSLPGIIIVLVVLAVFPQSMAAAMVTLGALLAPGLIRVVRSAVLPVKEELYIAAARVAGLNQPYIVFRHVLPRVAGPIIVQASLIAAVALIAQTGLAFLGLIVEPPAPSWGGMIAEGIQSLLLNPWLIWPPGLILAMTTLVLGLLGDIVRDATTEGWSGTARPYRRRGRTRVEEPAAPVQEDVLLSIQNLRLAFVTPSGANVRVVDDVSFDIGRGETVGLVGESGCGKSATAMSILGVLPGSGHVESGRILFDGVDLASLSAKDLTRFRGREIAVISQEPSVSLNPSFRIGWQLEEVVRRHTGASRRQSREKALELLRQVELPDPESVARRYPHELSGGMAQRVVIARALAGEPRLLIADEPTTALDVTVQAEILRLLRRLQRERGMSMLLITHDWGVIADVCDRALVMYAGEVVEVGSVDAIFTDPLHPYTVGLLASNPHHAAGSRQLPSIPGSVPPPGAWPDGCHFRTRCAYATEACAATDPLPLIEWQPARHARCVHVDRVREDRGVSA
jgi:peptide/nickel transport system permease protein